MNLTNHRPSPGNRSSTHHWYLGWQTENEAFFPTRVLVDRVGLICYCKQLFKIVPLLWKMMVCERREWDGILVSVWFWSSLQSQEVDERIRWKVRFVKIKAFWCDRSGSLQVQWGWKLFQSCSNCYVLVIIIDCVQLSLLVNRVSFPDALT